MSRIFAAVAAATVLIVSFGAIAAAEQDSGSDAQLLEDIVALFATGIDIAALVPIALIVGLLLATLGVLARS